jgi:hypothetical protein
MMEQLAYVPRVGGAKVIVPLPVKLIWSLELSG